MRLRSGRGRPEHGTLTYSRSATDRPFTVIVCAACAADRTLWVIDELRPTIRRCPHAMLVSAACLLGSLTCASRPTGYGVMAVLQPCTKERVACGPPHWIGPITDSDEVAALRDWLELGNGRSLHCQRSSAGITNGLVAPVCATDDDSNAAHRWRRPIFSPTSPRAVRCADEPAEACSINGGRRRGWPGRRCE